MYKLAQGLYEGPYEQYLYEYTTYEAPMGVRFIAMVSWKEWEKPTEVRRAPPCKEKETCHVGYCAKAVGSLAMTPALIIMALAEMYGGTYDHVKPRDFLHAP